jgi:hypothetical protein
MIANVQQVRQTTAHIIRTRFVSLLPQIQEQARFAFRDEPREHRQELIAEVIANAFVALVRLVERGLSDMIYPTPLAQYAIKQVRSGRRVGCKMNVHDVSSEYAQRAKHFAVERLDRYDERKREWKEVLVEDRKAGPADTAAARIDIGDWFESLPQHTRNIAETLAGGETTKTTAKKAWHEFQCEVVLV